MKTATKDMIFVDHGMYRMVEVPVKGLMNGLVITKQRAGYIIIVASTAKAIPGSFDLLKQAKKALVGLAELTDWRKITNGKRLGLGSMKKVRVLVKAIMEVTEEAKK